MATSLIARGKFSLLFQLVPHIIRSGAQGLRGILGPVEIQMSIAAYFSKSADLRMPKLPDGKDELGIRWTGRIVEGGLGVREALILQAAGVPVQPDDPARRFPYPQGAA